MRQHDHHIRRTGRHSRSLESKQVPHIISMSYVECEVQNGAAGNAAFKVAYQQGVLEGYRSLLPRAITERVYVTT